MKALSLSEERISTITYALQHIPNETARRHYLASESKNYDYGGISAIAKACNVSRSMIHRGLKEMAQEEPLPSGRQRKPGAGRPSFKSLFAKHMKVELTKSEYNYITIQELSNCDDNDISSGGIQESIADKVSSQQNTVSTTNSASEHDNAPQGSANTDDASNKHSGKKQRKLDIDRIIREYPVLSDLNPNTIILPKDPYSVESWIEYIIEEQFAAIYGNPAAHHMYVNLTLGEIKERLESRTHCKISVTTLWTIMREMGFSLHKNMKYEQVGEQHSQRDEQFLYIQSLIDEYKRSGDIIFSLDAKAAIKLGCFLANGRVWCPQKQPPHVLDHDFALLFKEIYPNGSEILPEHLLNRRAIVKPSGVYDVVHNCAHVTIGVSHDTSEFAGASLINAWNRLKDLYPNAKRILLLSDGGGSNRSTGILWKTEVAKFHELTKLSVMVCHYPPGCSKYDPIEHRLWSMISKNWQGSPLLDIERVMYFISSTTTKTGLKVTCELDTNDYLTLAQKKEACIPVISKKEFLETTKITFPNTNGALTTWNYLIGE